MTDLPAWAATPEGRSLITRIIAEQPESFTRSNRLPSIYGGYPGIPERHYTGKAVHQLRALYNHRRDRLIRGADAAYFAGTAWDEASRDLNELLASEQPDQLIERVLQLTETVGDPFLADRVNRRIAEHQRRAA